MVHHEQVLPASRRGFLGKLVAGVSAFGFATVLSPLKSNARSEFSALPNADDPDAWFAQIKGKHRLLIDSTEPNGIMPFAWPRVFLLTNQATGTTEKDCNVVVVLRHNAVAYALTDEMWTKYKLGETFNIIDPQTKAPAVRNPFWKPKEGEYKVPGVGPVSIGINELQSSGVMFCVCDVALTVHTAVMAEKMKLDPAALKKEWVAAVLPGVQVMPSGIWAVGRAQEHGCAYCYGG